MRALTPVLTLLVCVTNGQLELKGSLSVCLSTSGSSLNACLVELAEKLRPFMSTGLPDYKVPPTDPMEVDKVVLNLVKPPINVTVKFNNVVIRGLSSYVLHNVRTDFNRKTVSTNMTIRSMTSNGKYGLSGVAIIDLTDSNGDFRMRMNDVNVILSAQMAVKNGKLFIDEDPKIDVKVGKLKVELDNLFGGATPVFAETILKFINEDSDRFIKDFGPQITNQVGGLAKGVYNAAVSDLDPEVFGL